MLFVFHAFIDRCGSLDRYGFIDWVGFTSDALVRVLHLLALILAVLVLLYGELGETASLPEVPTHPSHGQFYRVGHGTRQLGLASHAGQGAQAAAAQRALRR